MLSKPILAKCDDRTRQARTHPDREPEKWLADPHLALHGLVGLTFNFFVNWNAGSIPNQLWIKRIVDKSINPKSIISSHDIISEAIYQCDGKEKVEKFCEFANKYSWSCHYFLIQEFPNYKNPLFNYVEVTFDENGSVIDVQEISLSTLVKRIQHLRGGPFSTKKTLNYATTSLECFLSKQTSAAWPGDADMVLVDANFTPVAIIEFKKHTSYSDIPFADQKLSKYYRKDPLKYDSFAYFRDHFTDDPSTLPIIVLYYSIEAHINQVMLELIEGAAGSLTATDPVPIPLPNANDDHSCGAFVSSLLEMINYETQI